jgi:hypothetical protein
MGKIAHVLPTVLSKEKFSLKMLQNQNIYCLIFYYGKRQDLLKS